MRWLRKLNKIARSAFSYTRIVIEGRKVVLHLQHSHSIASSDFYFNFKAMSGYYFQSYFQFNKEDILRMV